MCERVCESVCVRERERECVSLCVCERVCESVCVCERKRERECVCVCVRVFTQQVPLQSFVQFR